jgi:hypothetical protein
MPTVEVDLAEYIEMLVRLNETDPARWPAEVRDGAEWLRRLRQIEADCVAQHGRFDWARLSRPVQDEYDGLRAQLNLLRDAGRPGIDGEDFLAELRQP